MGKPMPSRNQVAKDERSRAYEEAKRKRQELRQDQRVNGSYIQKARNRMRNGRGGSSS